jgi:hypothetical protein
MSHAIVSHNQFFFNLGSVDRLTLEASLPLHKAYVAGTPAQRTDLRQRAVLHYVMGKLDITQAKAERILEQTRSQRSAEHEKAVNAASKKAAHHLVRGFKDQQAKTEPKVIKVNASKVKAIIELADGMTKAEFDALLKAVRESVVFE